VASLLFAGLACWISPVRFLLPAYFGLAFPVILGLTIFFLLFWAVRLKWYFVISLTALLLSYQNVYDTFPLSRKKEIPDGSIKVLSYNVHLFGFYTPLSKNEIIDYIVNSEADIVCLQEFGYSSIPKKDYLKKNEIFETLQKIYPYHHIELTQIKKSGSYGVATFSKFPILRKARVQYDSKYNSTIYSDMQIHGKEVRVFNCHLESNQLTENDKVLIKNLGEEYRNDRINEVVEHLSQKLGRSYKFRAKQADAIAEEISKTDLPIILCGDFNDVPVSYAYTKIRGNRLRDSFTESGNGYGYTFNEKLFWFRIDHIMHSKDFSAYRFRIDKVNYSDHFPVECYLHIE
jgi:endonuclease/exonuclease/phosphatase family metal-dependent hydrolase